MAGGLVILCVVDCRHGNMLLVCVALTTGCLGVQYLAVMSLPLQLSRTNAADVGALSSLIANAAKFTASFGLCHVAQAVSPCWFLVRLLRVDLIKWVSNVRPSVRPQKVSSISITFGM